MNLSMDLSGEYPAAQTVTRSVVYQRGKSVEIQDAITLKQAGDIWWFLHTRAQATVSRDGRAVTLAQAGKTLLVSIVEPGSCRFEVGRAEPLPTSPHPALQASNPGITRIAIHMAHTQKTDIRVLFE